LQRCIVTKSERIFLVLFIALLTSKTRHYANFTNLTN
jgi:hypothetical protein